MTSTQPLFYQFYFYAPGSNDWGILFMIPDRMIGAYCFCPVCLFVCLFVCLSVVNFNLRYNIWTVRDRDFIFGMHTPLMMPFLMTPRSMTLWLDFDLEAKNSFFDFVAIGGHTVVFHNHPLDFLYARLQTGHIMVWWCPSRSPSVRPTLRLSGSPSARFSHFSPTCFDILSWNFAHDFVLMYYGSSSSVVTLCQFLKELCFFVNSEYKKCAVFPHFSLHALTYWAEILHLIFVLMYYRSSFECRHFASIFEGVMPLCELRT